MGELLQVRSGTRAAPCTTEIRTASEVPGLRRNHATATVWKASQCLLESTNGTKQSTNNNETMNDDAHTELVKLESEDPKTHALLCAILDGQRGLEKRMEHSDSDRHKEYLEYLEEWEEAVQDAYFHDRRVASPDVDVEADD